MDYRHFFKTSLHPLSWVRSGGDFSQRQRGDLPTTRHTSQGTTVNSSRRAVYWLALPGAFLIAMMLATNYTLNHFYVHGGYMLDSGWFAYLFSHTDSLAAPNPAVVGGSYFSTHFSPIILVFSGIHALVSRLLFPIPPAVYFSLIQGLWFGLMAMATLMLLLHRAQKTNANIAAGLVVAVAATFNGIAMANMGFPHFEIAMPALLMLYLALHIHGRTGLATLAIIAGLLIREDAGLHYACLLLSLAACLYLAQGQAERSTVRRLVITGIACLLYATLAILLQKLVYGGADNALQRVYFGSPALAHVNADFLLEKIQFLSVHRAYLFFPVALLILLFIARRNAVHLAAPIAVLPWLALSFVAITEEAGHLTSYYSFPLIVCALWIPVAAALSPDADSAQRSLPATLGLMALMTIGSAALLAPSGENHDTQPWKHFGFGWSESIRDNQMTVDRLMLRIKDYPPLMVDDAVASLAPDQVTLANWRYRLDFPQGHYPFMDALAFMPQTWLTAQVQQIIEQQGLHTQCRLGNSGIFLACRSEAANACKLHCPR